MTFLFPQRGGTHSHDSSLHTFTAHRNKGRSFFRAEGFSFYRSTLFCRIRNLNPIEALERVAKFEGYIIVRPINRPRPRPRPNLGLFDQPRRRPRPKWATSASASASVKLAGNRGFGRG